MVYNLHQQAEFGHDLLNFKQDDLLSRTKLLNTMNRPSESDYRSVERYIFDKKPLIDEEQDFIYVKNDLVTLREGREDAFLDTLIERFLQVFHCEFLQVLLLPLPFHQ